MTTATHADLSHIPSGARVLVAFSGGADSMALLYCLHTAGLPLVAAHINHALRGPASDADAAFVAGHCAQVGISCIVEAVEVPRKADNQTTEAAARDVRYAALERLALAHGCAVIATGHTAGDQLETVLINLLRGAAVTGLGGMPAARPLASGGLLVRPLLLVPRARTREICRAAGWEWREDATNTDPAFLRNRVRHEIGPLLAALTGGDDARLEQQVARSCAVLQDDLNYLDTVATSTLASLAVPATPGVLALDGVAFRDLPVALQRRVLRRAAEQVRGSLRDVSFDAVETARLQIHGDERRAVWQWTRELHVEWTGAGAGNRIRFWLVK